MSTQSSHSVSNIVSIEFLDASFMKPLYYRNHRTNGQKNLRCFPQCSANHVEFGFCGTSLSVLLTVEKTFDINGLMIVGCFQPTEKTPDSDTFFNIPAEGLPEAQLQQFLRTKELQQRQYYTSVVQSITIEGDFYVLRVEFTLDFGSWHYAWRGARFKQDHRHEFQVTVLSSITKPGMTLSSASTSASKNSVTFLSVIAQASSPSFLVHSLRRKDSPASLRPPRHKNCKLTNQNPAATSAVSDSLNNAQQSTTSHSVCKVSRRYKNGSTIALKYNGVLFPMRSLPQPTVALPCLDDELEANYDEVPPIEKTVTLSWDWFLDLFRLSLKPSPHTPRRSTLASTSTLALSVSNLPRSSQSDSNHLPSSLAMTQSDRLGDDEEEEDGEGGFDDSGNAIEGSDRCVHFEAGEQLTSSDDVYNDGQVMDESKTYSQYALFGSSAGVGSSTIRGPSALPLSEVDFEEEMLDLQSRLLLMPQLSDDAQIDEESYIALPLAKEPPLELVSSISSEDKSWVLSDVHQSLQCSRYRGDDDDAGDGIDFSSGNSSATDSPDNASTSRHSLPAVAAVAPEYTPEDILEQCGVEDVVCINKISRRRCVSFADDTEDIELAYRNVANQTVRCGHYDNVISKKNKIMNTSTNSDTCAGAVLHETGDPGPERGVTSRTRRDAAANHEPVSAPNPAPCKAYSSSSSSSSSNSIFTPIIDSTMSCASFEPGTTQHSPSEPSTSSHRSRARQTSVVFEDAVRSYM